MGNAVGIGTKPKAEPVSESSSFIQDVYDISEDVLGRGETSVVKRAIHKVSGKHVAVKIINKAQCQGQDKSNVQREIAIMRHLQEKPHPSVIGLHQVFETTRHVYLVMDYAEGGELFDRLTNMNESEGSFSRGSFKSSRMSEEQAARICMELIQGIKHLHSHGVVHRNLKPETIFCTSMGDSFGVKIAQFSLAAFQSGEDAEPLQRFCGSRSYIAPEIYRAEGYGKECDVWSAGVVLYILLSGSPPFDSEAPPEVLQADIVDMRYSLEDSNWAQVSTEAKDLVQQMLQADVSCRITCEEILRHPWLARAVKVVKPSPLKREWSSRRFLASLLGGNKTIEAAKAAEAARAPSMPVRLRQQALAAQKAHLFEDDFSRSRSAETWRDHEVRAGREQLEAGTHSQGQLAPLSRGNTFPLRQKRASLSSVDSNEKEKSHSPKLAGSGLRSPKSAMRSPKGLDGSERRNRPDRVGELRGGSFRSSHTVLQREQLEWAGRKSPMGKGINPVLGRNSPKMLVPIRQTSPSNKSSKHISDRERDSPQSGARSPTGRSSPGPLKRSGSSRRKLPPPPIKIINGGEESESTTEPERAERPERPFQSPKTRMRIERRGSGKTPASEGKSTDLRRRHSAEPDSTRADRGESSPMSRRSRDLRREVRRNSPASRTAKERRTPRVGGYPPEPAERVRPLSKFDDETLIEGMRPEDYEDLQAFRLAPSRSQQEVDAALSIYPAKSESAQHQPCGDGISQPSNSLLGTAELFGVLNSSPDEDEDKEGKPSLAPQIAVPAADMSFLPGVPFQMDAEDHWDVPAPLSRGGSTVGSSGRRTKAGSVATTPTGSMESLRDSPDARKRSPQYSANGASGLLVMGGSAGGAKELVNLSSAPSSEVVSTSEGCGGDVSNSNVSSLSKASEPASDRADTPQTRPGVPPELSPLTPPVTPSAAPPAAPPAPAAELSAADPPPAKSPVLTPTNAQNIRQNLMDLSCSSGNETEHDETEGLFAALVNLNVVHMPPAGIATRPSVSPDMASTPLEI